MDRDTTQAFNAGKTNVLGLDFNLNYYLQTNTYFFLNAAKLNTKNEAKEKVYFLPSLYVNGGVNLRLNSWNINFTSFYRGKRPLPSSHTVNTEHASGAIFHSNLSVTLNLTKQFKIYMLTQNLFDNKSAFPLSIDGYFIPLRSRVANLGLVFNL
jgi:outer membrane receptor for ferrienterochelin and colicin